MGDVKRGGNDGPRGPIQETVVPIPANPAPRVVETLVPIVPMDPVDSRSGSIPAERYTFERLHAEGGLGKVWIARDRELNREVALKEVRPEFADRPDALRRFLREAQVTGQLEHPNIVPVYELARRKEDGQPFYTMRLLRGQTLREEVADHHALSAEPLGRQKLLTSFVAICQAIGYAHSRGIIHRDLKPENVMIGGFGEVVVLDWGLARIIGRPEEPEGPVNEILTLPDVVLSPEASALTTRGALGTPAYMAPEQVAGDNQAIDARSDIYGLGTILFEILTGRPPFEGNDLLEVYRKISNDPTPRARERVPGVPKSLEAIALKAMARSPADRYARAVDLADDVQRYLAGEPVTAYREPWTIRARRWMNRHRVLVTSTAAASSVAILALAVTLAGYRSQGLGLVETLEKSEILQTAGIIEQINGYRFWTDAQLRSDFHRFPEGSPEKLRAGLGLLPVDDQPLDGLYQQILRANPETLGILLEALGRKHRPQILARLRRDYPVQSEAPKFAILCGLARYEPDNLLIDPDRAWIVARLMTLNRRDSLSIDRWTKLLAPILPRLVPELIATYDDPARDDDDRALCVTLLVGSARRPEDLVTLLKVARERDFTAFLTLALANRSKVVPLLDRAWKAIDSSVDPEVASRQRAQAAVALARLGEAETIWPMLRQADDPTDRWWLVDRLAPLGADPSSLIDRLSREPDVSIRRTLILALGGYVRSAISSQDLDRLNSMLVSRYRDDPDSGVHSAIDWLFRHWKMDLPLRAIDRSLAGQILEDRDWFVSVSGQTFAIVRGPVTFAMGPTSDEEGHEEELCRFPAHIRTIPRTFAIATREVTCAEFDQFFRANPKLESLQGHGSYKQSVSPTPDSPVNLVSWFLAAEYCRWLSDREKLDPSYPSVSVLDEAQAKGSLTTMTPDYLVRTGYRLPTAAEWEFSARAGTTTCRPSGPGEALLGRFAWFNGTGSSTTMPVGQLWPNDLGLFDVLGNIREICHPPVLWGEEILKRMSDDPFARPICKEEAIPGRGGSFSDISHYCRTSCRQGFDPTERHVNNGFRIVRTLPGP